MNKYVYEGQLKSAAYKDASEFAPSSHNHAAKDLSFSEKNTNYTNASNIQDAIEDIDAKLWDTVGQVDQIAEDYSNHRSDNNIHVNSAEKSNWNKPTFSTLMDNSANTYEATKIGDCVEFYGRVGVNVEIQNDKNPEGGPSVLISNTGVIGVKGEKENNFKSGYVSLSAANIGLGNVNNTSDKDKPISSATQNALDLLENKQIQQKAEGSCPILDNTVVIVNQIPISTDSSGNIYNAVGFKNGYRWSSSGKAETAASGYGITGFIPYSSGDQLRLKNVDISIDYPYIVCFTSNKTVLGTSLITSPPDENGIISANVTNWSNVAFIRLSLGTFSDISVATVNQDLNLGGNANVGWLITSSNEKIAPKTLVSQVVTPDLLPLDEWIDGKLEIMQGDIDRSTYGVQDHLVNNDLHIIIGERTKWTTAAETITNKESKWDTAYTHSQSTHAPANAEKNQNAYNRFGFTNATSTYASAPSDGEGSFVVEAQSTNHQLEFIAGNSLIEFNPTDGSYSDSVEITIHADPVGAAEEAETNAKAYADSIKNSLLNGAGAAYDTLKELGALIDENHDAIDALETVATNKADKSQITSLQSELDTHEANSVKHIPTCSTQDNGKFLRVINGIPTWATVPNAEEASF